MTPEEKKLNRGIASVLYELAARYPDVDDSAAPKAVFQFGNFVVRCRPTKPAITRVADKFKRSQIVGPGQKPFSMRSAYNGLRCVGPYEWC